MAETPKETSLLGLTSQIVVAYAANNAVEPASLPGLIRRVFEALQGTGIAKVEVMKRSPAVAIRKSVFPDYIVCLEDGKKLRLLKRHLQTTYGLTPDQYRERWKLSADYPMVAPNYAEMRSKLAKSLGFGRKKPAEMVAAVAQKTKKSMTSKSAAAVA